MAGFNKRNLLRYVSKQYLDWSERRDTSNWQVSWHLMSNEGSGTKHLNIETDINHLIEVLEQALAQLHAMKEARNAKIADHEGEVLDVREG